MNLEDKSLGFNNLLKKESSKYSSPEVVSDNNYDLKGDVFSLGVCFYYMCSFKYPSKSEYRRIPTIYSESLNDLI